MSLLLQSKKVKKLFVRKLKIGYAAQLTSKECPTKISQEAFHLDKFTDSGSDNKNKFELKVQELNELIGEFEKGDDKMKTSRTDNAKPNYITEYVKDKEKLNNNFSMERIAVGSKVHTGTEQLNKIIQNNLHKLYL